MKSIIYALLIISLSVVALGITNFITDTWISFIVTGTPPEPVSLHSASLNPVNNTMLIFGGKNSKYVPTGNLTKYDLIEDSWIKTNLTISALSANYAPTPRYGHASLTTSDNKMYIFGGRNQSHIFSDIYKYDMESDRWEELKINFENSTLPIARWGHVGVVYPLMNELWFFGGASTTDRDSGYLNDLVKFNFETNVWSSNITVNEGLAPVGGRFLASAVMTLTNEMIIFGGKSINSEKNVSYVTDSTYIFHLDSTLWLNITLNSSSITPEPKYGHSAVITPLGTMLIFAGNGSDDDAVSSVWRYDIAHYKWSIIISSGLGPNSRSGHTSITTLFNTMISFGGQSSGSHYYADLFKYNIINSVLRSSSDGTVLVVLLSLVGSMIVGLCFALDLMAEKNELARIEQAEKDAIAKNNEITLKQLREKKEKIERQPLFEKF